MIADIAVTVLVVLGICAALAVCQRPYRWAIDRCPTRIRTAATWLGLNPNEGNPT